MHLCLVLLFDLWRYLRKLDGVGLILMGILDASVIPTPGGLDVLTVILASRQKDWWLYYAGMATIGSALGGYLTFRLGRKGGQETIEQRLSKRKVERICNTFERYGFFAVFVPAILPPPIPFSPFLLTAGAMDYPVKKFMLALVLGRAVRFALVAYLSSIFGRQLLGFFAENYMAVIIGFIVVSVVAATSFFVHRSRRKKAGAEAPST